MKRASRYIIMLIMAASLFAGCKPTPKVTPTPTAPPSTPQTRTARPGLRTAPEVVVPRTVRPARYNLAILYDPAEKFPPSDKQALAKFLEVARRMNINAELITEADATRLMEFDALFIRTTTAINHYTFHLAQTAAMNDIVVIDDPESIIRCTNKVYLCELFEKYKIPAPKSRLIFRSNTNTFAQICAELGSPFILKIPDGSFSIGMHKVSDEAELDEALGVMFKQSAIVLAQEFTPTEYDWRIGLLGGEPLFACKYYMAKGHWQIYNHAHDAIRRIERAGLDVLLVGIVERCVLDLHRRAVVVEQLDDLPRTVMGQMRKLLASDTRTALRHAVAPAASA